MAVGEGEQRWRSRKNSGGGRRKKARVFFVERESTKGGERYLSEHRGGRTEVFK
jgi:hypothetical protein